MRPELKGTPFVIGADGDPAKRGFVSAVSAEAKKKGVKAGMTLRQAKKLCAEALFYPADLLSYEQASEKFMAILGDYSPLVESFGLDEAFVEVLSEKGKDPFPAALAMSTEIKSRVKRELGLTSSVGVGPNKLIGKMCSEAKRPAGYFVIEEREVEKFLRDLPVNSLCGAGAKICQRLRELGINTEREVGGNVPFVKLVQDHDESPVARKPAEHTKRGWPVLQHSPRRHRAIRYVGQLYGEKGFTTLERVWARPTLECNGIWGGFTGEGAKTVLPSKASAKISMRLVPNQTAARAAKMFESHIRKIAPQTVSVSVNYLHGGEPAITPIDSPGVKAAVAALEKGFGKRPLYQREGGSIPIVVQFKKLLGLDTVLLGFGLPDETAHAPNEFLNLGNFFSGIKTSAHFSGTNASVLAVDQSDTSVKRKVETFQGDFGLARVVLSPWIHPSSFFLVSSGRVRPVPLQGRSFQIERVGNTGDTVKGMVYGEYTVEIHQSQCMAQAHV